MSSRRHPSAWALWPTLGATWIAFAQVLSFQGLAIWVIGGSLLNALVVLPLAFAGRRLLAIAAAVGMTFVVPLLAETLGGNTAGPVTRSALMSCAVTGAMALILATRYPAAVLAPAVMLLGGALGLGAAERVPWLVGLWAVAAAVTLAMVGPYRQSHLRDRRRLAPFALMLLAIGSAAILAVALVAPFLGTPWTIPGSGEIAVPLTTSEVVPTPTPSSSPSSSSSLSPPRSTEATEAPSQEPTAEPTPEPSSQATVTPPPPTTEDVTPVEVEEASGLVSWLVWTLLLLLLLLLLVLLAMLLWRAWVWLLWRRLRGRLSSGTPEERAVGAWTWLRLRRARVDRPLPVSLSPDVAVAWSAAAGEPDVSVVASVAAAVAFNPEASVPSLEADRAWAAAVAGGLLAGGSWRARWRWSARRPAWARARMLEPSRDVAPVRTTTPR